MKMIGHKRLIPVAADTLNEIPIQPLLKKITKDAEKSPRIRSPTDFGEDCVSPSSYSLEHNDDGFTPVVTPNKPAETVKTKSRRNSGNSESSGSTGKRKSRELAGLLTETNPSPRNLRSSPESKNTSSSSDELQAKTSHSTGDGARTSVSSGSAGSVHQKAAAEVVRSATGVKRSLSVKSPMKATIQTSSVMAAPPANGGDSGSSTSGSDNSSRNNSPPTTQQQLHLQPASKVMSTAKTSKPKEGSGAAGGAATTANVNVQMKSHLAKLSSASRLDQVNALKALSKQAAECKCVLI